MRNLITYDWTTFFIFLGLLLIAIAKLLNAMRFNDFLYFLVNTNYLKIYLREKKQINLFDALLFTNFSIGISVFSFFGYAAFYDSTYLDLVVFLKIFCLISLAFIGKVGLERFVAWVFDITPLIKSYQFNKTSYRNYAGLILWFINILLAFTQIWDKVLVVISLILLAIIIGLGLITSIKFHLNKIKHNLFYFLLYLCALEIGPYIILYKAIAV